MSFLCFSIMFLEAKSTQNVIKLVTSVSDWIIKKILNFSCQNHNELMVFKNSVSQALRDNHKVYVGKLQRTRHIKFNISKKL